MNDLITLFNRWDAAIQRSAQGEWREEARDCFGMVAGDQVSQEDADAAKEKGLLYAVINKIDSTVSAICGSEITNRQEVRFYPRQATLEAAQANDLLSAAADWVRDECDAADEESEAFRDCITCGMGWTETRMEFSSDPDGMPVVERVDPLEMAWDASTRRPNLSDARYVRRKRRFSRAEAAERFGIDPDDYPGSSTLEPGGRPHNADPEMAYQGKGDLPLNKDELEIVEYQWRTLETVYRVLNPQTQQLEDLSPEEFERVQGLGLPHEAVRLWRYYRAFRISDQVIDHGPLPDDDFTLKCVTGKLDRNKGIWYGVVRAMIDPQRLLNKQVSQLQRIIDVTAKGGLLAEKDAFEDPDRAREDWAASDTIVYTTPGSVSGGKVVPKPVGQYPNAIDRMTAMMNEMVPGTSGVNNEMLGVIDREQAGVVEWQRKQAAYGVLAGFFSSLRRYRRMQGRHLLKLITKYMSDGRLIRVQGRTGDIRYAQLAKQPDTVKYDVIVDEAPAGPNQKERTFLFLTQFGAILEKLGLPPQVWAKMMEYTPLPASLVSEIQQIMQNTPPPQDPRAQAEAQKMQAGMQKMQFDMQARQADSQLKREEAQMRLMAEREKSEAQIAANAEQAQVKAQIDYRIAEMRAQIERDKAAAIAEIEQQRLEHKARLDMMQFDFERMMQEREALFREEMGRRGARIGGGGGRTEFGGEIG